MHVIGAIVAAVLLTAFLLFLLAYERRQATVGKARDLPQAYALDLLKAGFEWEYTHPGVLTFTLRDGRKVDAEGGIATSRWSMRT